MSGRLVGTRYLLKEHVLDLIFVTVLKSKYIYGTSGVPATMFVFNLAFPAEPCIGIHFLVQLYVTRQIYFPNSSMSVSHDKVLYI